MGLEYGFVVCARCGHGFDFEQLAQNDADHWQQVDLWRLPHGKELQPYLRLLWTPLCPQCGGDKFYPLINSDEIVDYLTEMLQDGTLIDETERKLAETMLALWQQRQQVEDVEWRKNAKAAPPDGDCDCGHSHRR